MDDGRILNSSSSPPPTPPCPDFPRALAPSPSLPYPICEYPPPRLDPPLTYTLSSPLSPVFPLFVSCAQKYLNPPNSCLCHFSAPLRASTPTSPGLPCFLRSSMCRPWRTSFNSLVSIFSPPALFFPPLETSPASSSPPVPNPPAITLLSPSSCSSFLFPPPSPLPPPAARTPL